MIKFYVFEFFVCGPLQYAGLDFQYKNLCKKKGNMKINQHETGQYGKIKTIYREKMIERTE